MVKTCIVKNCSSNSRKKCENHEKKSFFRFPTKFDDRSKWIKSVLCLNQQVLPKNIGKYSVICSKHFSNEQLKIKNEGYCLRKGAVPNIFPNYSDECTHVEYLETSLVEDPLNQMNIEVIVRPTSIDVLNVESSEELIPMDTFNIDLTEGPIDVNYQHSKVLNVKSTEGTITLNNQNKTNVNNENDADSLLMNCTQFTCDRCVHPNVVNLQEYSCNRKITLIKHIDKEKSLNCVQVQDRSDISVKHFFDQSTCAAKRSLADEFDDVVPNASSTPTSNIKKKCRIFYPGDVQENCDLSPESSKKYIAMLRKDILKQRMKTKQISQQNRRKSKKIASLQMVLQDLKEKGMISDNTENMLKVKICEHEDKFNFDCKKYFSGFIDNKDRRYPERGRGGFNNNPNAIQFMSAYKQLIVHNEVESSANGNCIPLDGTNVLTISSSKILHRNEDEDDQSILSQDYGKMSPNFGTLALSEAIIYVAGFVQRAITRIITCDDCLVALNARKNMGGSLLRNKNYGKHGGLCDPKQDVVVLCRIAERNLQALAINLHQPNMHQFLLTKCMREVPPKLLDNMEDHLKDCDLLDNHRYLLIKCIIQEYLKVKLCHLGKLKTMSIQTSFVRSQNTKLTLFIGQ